MSMFDILIILLIVFLIFYVTVKCINFIDKKANYKFIKYMLLLAPLLLGIYYIFEIYKGNCIGWEGIGCDYAIIFSSFVFIDLLLSCAIVDINNLYKNKKNKK